MPGSAVVQPSISKLPLNWEDKKKIGWFGGLCDKARVLETATNHRCGLPLWFLISKRGSELGSLSGVRPQNCSWVRPDPSACPG
jgi:hypothetical protein